jgi:hypothetical protein
MALEAGATVGRYQIQGLLGSGGMGEVYKAVDPVLGRPVALKVLRPELSGDPERLSRFLHEARAASALNHPNILTIHEVGDHAGSRFLVSEFVDGETLRERLNRGPLMLREILDITMQAASALATAHAAGIVHRDIKPDNLMLRPDGYVKVLDFGVATFATRAVPQDSQVTMATMAPPETGAGMIVGTIAYMSPEQARGLPVDGRSDCYSLGVVIYELLAGRAPFVASTSTDLLVAILEREPPSLRTVARGIPLQLEWIIEKALDKDAGLRYQTMADLRVDLHRLKSALESGKLEASAGSIGGPAADGEIERELTDDSPEVATVSGISWITAAIAAVAALALGAGMAFYDRARPGSDLPLQLPQGAVITKARDAVTSFGYANMGARTSTTFIDALDVEDIITMDGLPAAREAIRDGTAIAYWRAGITHTANPSGGLEPAAGDFSVRLDPRGQLIAFATGYANEGAIAHADRARATAIGLEAIKKSFGVDASSGYDLEVVERTFPAGKTEMTWRGSTKTYGHEQQFRVDLQGERLILIERSYQPPRGYTEPPTPMLMRIFRGTGPAILVAVFVIGWGFGLYYLFKTKNWDALTRRLPLAMCALVILQVVLSTIGESIFESLVGLIAITILLVGTVLPALSGVLLWIGRRSPARMWAAEQLARGRLMVPAVSASLLEGVAFGAVMAALAVFADWLALGIPGVNISISRELNVVDQGFGTMVGETLTTAAFLVLGVTFVVEALDRFRLNPIISTILVSVAAGMFAANDQFQLLPGLVQVIGMALGTAVVVLLYRRRGFLAAWIAGMASSLLTTAMALRSLEDQDLARTSSYLLTIVLAIAAAGVVGAGRRLLQKPEPLHAAAKLGVDRG